ncbi:MAG: hypothetical protein RLZZ450_1090 [Pseudomonadota bacterium]|jgi:cytochrome c553
MKWNRLLCAALVGLSHFASACTEDVGICQGSLQGRDTVWVNGNVMYGGQAILNKACAVGCHASGATGLARHGVPAGLDFDLLPVDQEDVAGTRKRGAVTVVKLTNTQVSGLRARQKKIVEQRNLIWQQIQDGLMPPGGMIDDVMSTIYASSEKTPCKRGKAYSKIPQVQTREVLRNWLACGAPLVETNNPKLDKSVATPGTAGYQYQECETEPAESVTLERLFATTFGDCGGCHNGSLTPPPRFVSVDGLADDLRTGKSCSGKPFVTPGDPDESYLLDLLKGPDPACNKQQMPVGEPLSARGIAEVTAWIAAGAPTTANDVGEPPRPSDSASTEDDEQSADADAEPTNEDEQTTTHDAGPVRDAGPVKDAGISKDAGPVKDAGVTKDAGRDAGRSP